MESHNRVLVVASGSIALLQLPNYLKGIKDRGWHCKCVMTPQAARIMRPETIASFVDTFTDEGHWGASIARVPHIDLATWAKVIVVLPATMNFIGNLASGLAPNLAATTVLSSDSPVLIYPNLFETMMRIPAVQRNLTQLQADGYHVFSEVRSAYSVGRASEMSSIILPSVAETVSDIEHYLVAVSEI